ncbi:MAG: nucleotidyl transferase AbiEii/AbiGii toxin family protein [Prevotellaceae bacterium]|jgi:hypothetical protein|nr:nucleotidyl transferase AbiEii/AbiGii toxin family protein [Prevotellaceae bacterium]
MNLHTEKDAFRELIELTADSFGYEQSHVEKDYWISKILKELASSAFASRIFFKGGTSLSKAYRITGRFSEDLDMFVFTSNANSSKQSEKTLNRNVSHFITENNRDMYVEALSKTGGDFRKLAFSYNTHYPSVGLKENLEVELKCCMLDDKTVMYYPFESKRIQPIITEYLQHISNPSIISRFGLEDFDIQTISPKRTLCDKISRLTRLSYNDDFKTLIAKHIRDVYDIYKILSLPEYQSFINSEDFSDALRRVTNEDGLYKNSQLHNPISKAQIFEHTRQVLKFPSVSRAYNSELRKLMFNMDDLPALDDIIDCFYTLQSRLQAFDERTGRSLFAR